MTKTDDAVSKLKAFPVELGIGPARLRRGARA
jgi:hypothetical protein